MTTAGKKVVNYSTTVGTAQITLIKDGVPTCEKGKVLIANPNSSGNIRIGLAGEALSTLTLGWPLGPGAGIIIDDPHNNAITAIADTAGLNITAYAIPGN
jgi:hypothetical protein